MSMGQGAASAGLATVVQQVLVTDANRATARRTPAGLIELLTNAIKDTVSVLYWYEELSSFKLAIFGRVLRNFFLCHASFPLRGPSANRQQKRWEYGTQGSQVITDLSTN